MGYTWEAWALDPARLVAELTSPGLAAGSVVVDPHDDVVVAAVRRWDALAAQVAGAVRDGGGDLTGDLANYVVAVVRTLGSFAGSVGHTSSGGDWFRDDLMGGEVAGVLGRDTARDLLVRELAGLTVLDGPGLGWLDAAGCRAGAASAAAFAGDDSTTEDLWSVLDALPRGIRADGLVTLYV